MNAGELLDLVTIPTPCPVAWGDMEGDDRVRSCAACGKHVYNFAALTADEAVAVIRENDGELCGQLRRRPDGTLVTADCSRPAPASPGPWQFSIWALMALIAGIGALLGFARPLVADRTEPVPPTTTVIGGAISIPRSAMQAIGPPPGQAPDSILPAEPPG